jgi:hypothetical protein
MLMLAASDLLRAHLRRHDKNSQASIETTKSESAAVLVAATCGNSTVHSFKPLLDSQDRAPDRNIDEHFVPNPDE